MLLSLVFIIAMIVSKEIFASYIPRIFLNEVNTATVLAYIAYFLICNLPMIINVMEDMRWKSLQSKI